MTTLSTPVTTITGSSSPYTGGAIAVDATADRALYYWITYVNTAAATPTLVSSITRDGQSATRVTGHRYEYNASNIKHGELWKISNPNTGSASSSISTSASLTDAAITIFAAYATSGESSADAGGGYGTAISQSAASTSTDDIDLLLVSFNNGYNTDITPTSPMTQFAESGYYGGNWIGTRAGASGGTTVAGTLNAARAFAAIGISILNAGSGSTPIAFTGTIPAQTFTAGDSVDVDLSTYFSGTETPFSYSSVGASFAALGLSINSSTGHLTGTAVEGEVTGCQIRGTDATPDTADSNTFTITVGAANSAPSWSGTPSAMSAKKGQALTPQDITSLVSDADLDTLTYSITGAPTGVTINSSTGVISGTPTAAPGVYACTVEADDGVNSPVSSSSFNITVQQCVLALNSAGYEFANGNAPATVALVASTELQVAAYPLTEWPPASAIATATATTGTNGRLADLGDDDLVFGTTYRVIARNAADGETWAWTMAAS